MFIPRSEFKKFEKSVSKWLQKEGVRFKSINIEGNRSKSEHVFYWKDSSCEYILINKDDWNKFVHEYYKKIKMKYLRLLRRGK